MYGLQIMTVVEILVVAYGSYYMISYDLIQWGNVGTVLCQRIVFDSVTRYKDYLWLTNQCLSQCPSRAGQFGSPINPYDICIRFSVIFILLSNINFRHLNLRACLPKFLTSYGISMYFKTLIPLLVSRYLIRCYICLCSTSLLF